MSTFIGRQQELAELRALATETEAQFLILYGRRRVGKTTLLLQWAQESGYPFIYWVANRFSPILQLRSLSQTIFQALHPDTPVAAEFTYPTWEMAFQQVAQLAVTRRLVLILDEFPYMAEAEPGLPALVQNLWAHLFKQTQIFLVLAGSHIWYDDRVARLSRPPLWPLHRASTSQTATLCGYRPISTRL
ncbi:MAG: ATP-binding protein [Caldilineaceae bacterium]